MGSEYLSICSLKTLHRKMIMIVIFSLIKKKRKKKTQKPKPHKNQ